MVRVVTPIPCDKGGRRIMIIIVIIIMIMITSDNDNAVFWGSLMVVFTRHGGWRYLPTSLNLSDLVWVIFVLMNSIIHYSASFCFFFKTKIVFKIKYNYVNSYPPIVTHNQVVQIQLPYTQYKLLFEPTDRCCVYDNQSI